VKRQTQNFSLKTAQIGRVSLFQVVALGLLIVIIVVGFFLYLPSDARTVEDSVPETVLEPSITSNVPNSSVAQNTVDTPIIKKEVAITELGYCAEKDIEVIGYEWEHHLARAKTLSANRKTIDANNLSQSPSFQQYSTKNMQSQYAELNAFYGEGDALPLSPLDHNLINEISSTHEEEFGQLIEKYAGNKAFLASILGVFSRQISDENFAQILDSHDDINNDFVFKLFSSSFQVSSGFIEAILKKAENTAPISKNNINRGNHLLFVALSNGNFAYIPYILDLDINFIPTQDASLYHALKNGAQRTSMTKAAFLDYQKQIEAISGRPSFNDIIAVSLFTKENVLDKFIQYGLNVEDYVNYPANTDIRDISDDEIREKLAIARRKWPRYILRINPNSNCLNATEFHWTAEELISWYNARVKTDDDFEQADEELAQISRLYVDRAHFLYYSGALNLKPQEFRIEKDRVFFEEVVSAIFEPDINIGIGDKLAILSSEVNSDERRNILRFYIISLVRNTRTLDASTNLGFVYNESDMVTAVRAGNQDALNWLLRNGIGLNGADPLNNGILKWLILNKSENVISNSPLENIPSIYNSFSLSPHELHYLQCENYGSVDLAFRRSEIGKDIKQQVNSTVCENLSGYRNAFTSRSDLLVKFVSDQYARKPPASAYKKIDHY
jgi:hypothetical protein